MSKYTTSGGYVAEGPDSNGFVTVEETNGCWTCGDYQSFDLTRADIVQMLAMFNGAEQGEKVNKGGGE